MTYQTPHDPAQPRVAPPARNTFWSRRNAGQQAGIIITAILLPCCGGLTLLGALVDDPGAADTRSGDRPAAVEQPAGTAAATTTAALAAPTPTTSSPSPGTPPPSTPPPRTSTTPTPVVPPAPQVAKRTVTETRTIAFSTRRVKDATLAKGSTTVRTPGVAGIRTLTYEVTTTDGVQTARKLVRSVVTRKPVTKVIAVGTKVATEDRCDPNYGGCVPIASDVDCAGGSGNGPEYVSGPVRVIGNDIYDLDRDSDGTGCD